MTQTTYANCLGLFEAETKIQLRENDVWEGELEPSASFEGSQAYLLGAGNPNHGGTVHRHKFPGTKRPSFVSKTYNLQDAANNDFTALNILRNLSRGIVRGPKEAIQKLGPKSLKLTDERGMPLDRFLENESYPKEMRAAAKKAFLDYIQYAREEIMRHTTGYLNLFKKVSDNPWVMGEGEMRLEIELTQQGDIANPFMLKELSVWLKPDNFVVTLNGEIVLIDPH